MIRYKQGIPIQIPDALWNRLPEKEKAKFDPIEGVEEPQSDGLTIERITQQKKTEVAADVTKEDEPKEPEQTKTDEIPGVTVLPKKPKQARKPRKKSGK